MRPGGPWLLARLFLVGLGLPYPLYPLLTGAPPLLAILGGVALGLRLGFALHPSRHLLSSAALLELLLVGFAPLPLLVAALLVPPSLASYMAARPLALVGVVMGGLRRGGRESVTREVELSSLLLLHRTGGMLASALALDLLVVGLASLEVPGLGLGLVFILMGMVLGLAGLLLRPRRGGPG